MEFIGILLFVAAVSAAVAHSRGRSIVAWFVLGLLFNVLALIAVAVLPSRRDRPHPSTHVRCPDCREFIFRRARVCKHCGCRLTPQ